MKRKLMGVVASAMLSGCTTITVPGIPSIRVVNPKDSVETQLKTLAEPPTVGELVTSAQKTLITWNANYTDTARHSDIWGSGIIALASAAVSAVVFHAPLDVAAGIGLGAGTFAVTRDYWAPPELDRIYIAGHRALSCFISNSTPFLENDEHRQLALVME